MSTVKTAISIEKPLFEELEALAEEMDVSRSHLFALAAREFIQRHKSRKLLDALNAAYSDQRELGEERLRARMRPRYRALVEDQW